MIDGKDDERFRAYVLVFTFDKESERQVVDPGHLTTSNHDSLTEPCDPEILIRPQSYD
jgi:hypothetical protein